MNEGILYVVGTPIGNLEDITLRAVRILKESDFILCENPRNSMKLLAKLEIDKSLLDIQRQSDSDKGIQLLKSGNKISLISDAGTPGVSDPGAIFIRTARKEGISIIPIPGPSALTAILSVSGSKSNPTVFLGFLPEKSGKKKSLLEEYSKNEAVLVIYESVHRIIKTLELIREVFPEAEILVGRELTKSFEEIKVYSPGESNFENLKAKGEFVVLINNHSKKNAKDRVNQTDSVYQ